MSSEQSPANSRRGGAREALLDAAERVTAAIGAGHMTLEAVAKEACVSKGGLLYHFPSKEALITAMIERHIARLSEIAKLGSAATTAQEAIAGLIRDYGERASLREESRRTAHGLIAAIAERPALLEPLRGYHKELWKRLASCKSRPALIAWLAIQGLVFLDIFNTSPIPEEERGRVIDELLAFLTGNDP